MPLPTNPKTKPTTVPKRSHAFDADIAERANPPIKAAFIAPRATSPPPMPEISERPMKNNATELTTAIPNRTGNQNDP